MPVTMAEIIARPPANFRRELLIIIIVGWGTAFYSLGAMWLYDAPPPAAEIKIELQARAHTAPSENHAEEMLARVDSSPATVEVPATTPTPPAVPAPLAARAVETTAKTTAPPAVAQARSASRAPSAPTVSPAATPAKPASTSSPVAASLTAAPPTPALTAAPSSPAPPITVAASSTPAPTAHERIRIVRVRENGHWVEIQDFTHGIDYRGPIDDFSRGTVPRRILESERRP